jgi:excisionase family DNA binding protein
MRWSREEPRQARPRRVGRWGHGDVTDRLLVAKDLAELLNVPESWVREHTRSGSIPHLELGRYKRYRLDEVLAWLDELAAGEGPSKE